MNPMNIMALLQQFRQNPMQMLMQRRMNVPANISNDPQAILNHLLQTGQVSQDQVNRAYQMAQSFRK
ncbi:MAG: hypothetical protein J6S60_04910 [Oscillospiraceae bacterium]|nr:hypothetical protein [Oscillospiraceae bacterium]